MLVHISVTDPELIAERDRVAAALRDAGTDVSVDDGSTAESVGSADALVCLVGRHGSLLADCTQFGERPVNEALRRDMPTMAYELAAEVLDDPTDHREGYALARHERLRRQLRRGARLTPVSERAALPEMVLRDLERTSGLLRQTAPDAFRELHRRIRQHPGASYAALSVSMHNVDQLYWVPEVPANREISGSYLGAEPGGAGANTMVALRRLGLAAAVTGAVGDDAEGRMVRRALEDDDVSTTLLLTVSGVATGRTVMLRAADGGYSNVVDSGANAHFASEIEQRDDSRRLLVDTAARSSVLHFSSFATSAGRRVQASLLYEVPEQTIVSYKPGTMDSELGVDRLEAVLGRCDVLFVAEAELDLLLRHMSGFDQAMSVSAKLDLLFEWRQRRGDVRSLVIAVIAGLEDPTKVDPVRLHWGTERHEGTVGPDLTVTGSRSEIKDLAGARDAIVAGVLFGLLRSRPPIDCVNLAIVLAVSAFAEFGCRGALLRPTQVRERWHQLLGGEPPRWLDPYG